MPDTFSVPSGAQATSSSFQHQVRSFSNERRLSFDRNACVNTSQPRLPSVILTPEGFPKDDFLSDFAAGPPVRHISMRWTIFHEREGEREMSRWPREQYLYPTKAGFMRPLFGEDSIEEGIIRATIWAHNCFMVSKLVLIKEDYTLFLVPVNWSFFHWPILMYIKLG